MREKIKLKKRYKCECSCITYMVKVNSILSLNTYTTTSSFIWMCMEKFENLRETLKEISMLQAFILCAWTRCVWERGASMWYNGIRILLQHFMTQYQYMRFIRTKKYYPGNLMMTITSWIIFLVQKVPRIINRYFYTSICT